MRKKTKLKKTVIQIQTDYLNKIYHVDQFVKVVDRAAKTLRAFRRKNHFDAIAFTGTSGAALAYPLSLKLKIPLICVRKSTRDNHFGSKLEGFVSAGSYIIVDDFIQSGTTIRKIRKAIKDGGYGWDATNSQSKLVGIYLYSQAIFAGDKFSDIPLLGYK